MDIGVNMGNTHIDYANKKVKQVDALDAPDALSGFLEDDRVTCDTCQHCGTKDADEFIDLDRAKQLRSMGKRLGLKGDRFEQKGKWLRISWTEGHCAATGFSPQPSHLPHRCHLYCKATEKPSSVESDAWWLD